MVGSTPTSSSAPRAVLDTSVLMSEHRHWLWGLAKFDYYEAVWSTFIVGELARVRTELSIARGVERGFYRERINNLIHLLSDVLLVGDYPSAATSNILSDPEDEPILATALAAGAGIVVSLNTRDFPPSGEVLGVRFLTPQAFLATLETRHPQVDLPQRIRDIDRPLP